MNPFPQISRRYGLLPVMMSVNGSLKVAFLIKAFARRVHTYTFEQWSEFSCGTSGESVV